MSRIVFAWQLGGNYGHLTTDLPIAQQLRKSGHEVVFIVADTRIAEEVLMPHGFTFAAAPALAVAATTARPQRSYADIMAASGFGDDSALAKSAGQWSALLSAIHPAVVVADHAPLAVLAARLLGIPSVMIGNGFTLPPPLCPLPSIRPWENTADEQLRQLEAPLLARINRLMTRASPAAAQLAQVSQLFDESIAVCTSFADLDPYGHRSRVHYVGPAAVQSGAAPLAWQEDPRPRVFAYLQARAPHLQQVLGGLEQSAAQVICSLPGAGAEIEQHFRGTSLRLISRTLPLTGLLAGAQAVVSHGGSGLICDALLAGVPLVLIPKNPEQYLGSLQVAKLRAALVIGPQQPGLDFADALDRVLHDPAFRAAAHSFAARHLAHDRSGAAALAASLISASADRKAAIA